MLKGVNKKYQGAMTWSLLDTLNTSGKLTWRELLLSMSKRLKMKGFTQIPQLSTGHDCDINNTFIL